MKSNAPKSKITVELSEVNMRRCIFTLQRGLLNQQRSMSAFCAVLCMLKMTLIKLSASFIVLQMVCFSQDSASSCLGCSCAKTRKAYIYGWIQVKSSQKRFPLVWVLCPTFRAIFRANSGRLLSSFPAFSWTIKSAFSRFQSSLVSFSQF